MSDNIGTKKRVRNDRDSLSPEVTAVKHQKIKMQMSELSVDDFRKLLDEALESKLGDKLQILATKEDIKEIKEDIVVIKTENGILNEEIKEIKEQNQALQEQVLKLQIDARRNNLMFKNMPEPNGDNDVPKNTISDMCRSAGANVTVKTAKWVGNRFQRNGKFYRHALVTFDTWEETKDVLSKKQNLNSTGIMVVKDLPLVVRQLKFKIFKIKKEFLKKDGNAKITNGYNWIEINGIKYVWNGSEFISNNNQMASDINSLLNMSEEVMELNGEQVDGAAETS